MSADMSSPPPTQQALPVQAAEGDPESTAPQEETAAKAEALLRHGRMTKCRDRLQRRIEDLQRWRAAIWRRMMEKISLKQHIESRVRNCDYRLLMEEMKFQELEGAVKEGQQLKQDLAGLTARLQEEMEAEKPQSLRQMDLGQCKSAIEGLQEFGRVNKTRSLQAHMAAVHKACQQGASGPDACSPAEQFKRKFDDLLEEVDTKLSQDTRDLQEAEANNKANAEDKKTGPEKLLATYYVDIEQRKKILYKCERHTDDCVQKIQACRGYLETLGKTQACDSEDACPLPELECEQQGPEMDSFLADVEELLACTKGGEYGCLGV